MMLFSKTTEGLSGFLEVGILRVLVTARFSNLILYEIVEDITI